MVLLLFGLLASVVQAVALVQGQAARRQVAEDLLGGRRVFEEQQALLQSLHRSECRVMSEEPRLKAVVDEWDVTPETILGVALDLRKAVGSDVFVLTDATGRILADVNDPQALGAELDHNPVVAQALRQGEASGVWIAGKRVFRVQARLLTFGRTPLGVLVMGYAIDDRTTRTLYRQTGDSLIIELNGEAIAASPLHDGQRVEAAALSQVFKEVASGTDLVETTIHSVRYLALTSPFPGYSGKHRLRYVILRSLDRALEPGRRLMRVLYAIAAFGLLGAVLLAVWLSRPLDDLCTATRHIAAGNLEGGVRVRGPVEIRALGEAMDRMAAEILAARERQAQEQRMRRDLEIAAQIQDTILPDSLEVAGLEMAAFMQPAEEVGGDYYDVLPCPGGAFIGIGDVAGHGLKSGLVMVMIQSIVAALVRRDPTASPRELVRVLNTILYDNIRLRMQQDEHATFTLMRYWEDGEIVFAGAHEEMLVCRAEAGCEQIETPGTWLGVCPDVGPFLEERRLRLHPGDLLVVYSDGLSQAMNADYEQFGMERLQAVVHAARHLPVAEIRDRVLAAVRSFWASQEDDVTLMVIRYRGPAAGRAS
jgi:sigma-B regulation protein RsbU (phosphoserine phosphatase)